MYVYVFLYYYSKCRGEWRNPSTFFSIIYHNLHNPAGYRLYSIKAFMSLLLRMTRGNPNFARQCLVYTLRCSDIHHEKKEEEATGLVSPFSIPASLSKKDQETNKTTPQNENIV
jgi:hypothetical protein